MKGVDRRREEPVVLVNVISWQDCRVGQKIRSKLPVLGVGRND